MNEEGVKSELRVIVSNYIPGTTVANKLIDDLFVLVSDLFSAGYDMGFADGHESGWADGYAECAWNSNEN